MAAIICVFQILWVYGGLLIGFPTSGYMERDGRVGQLHSVSAYFARYPCCSISHTESRVSIPSVTLKKRSVLWRRIFQIERVLVTIGLVVYALLVSINQPASLFIIMIATLTVGNLVIPLAFASRRLYVTRPFP